MSKCSSVGNHMSRLSLTFWVTKITAELRTVNSDFIERILTSQIATYLRR